MSGHAPCPMAFKKLSRPSFVCPADSREQLEQLEATKSGVKKELVLTKEVLCKVTLEKEVLEDEKARGAEALAKAGAPWGSRGAFLGS